MLLFCYLLLRFLLWFFVIFLLFAVEYVSGNKLDKFVVENVEDFVSDYVQFVLLVRQVVLQDLDQCLAYLSHIMEQYWLHPSIRHLLAVKRAL